MEPHPVPQEWLIDIPLIVGKPLGISVMENTGVLTSVHKTGIIPEMNAKHPELAAQNDDRIVEVNGVAGDAVMLLKKSLARHDKALRLRLCRPVHVSVAVDLDGDDLGLVVEKSTGTITAIRDGSAVAKCAGPGIQIGDRVVKVNGREPGEDDNIMPWLRLAVAGGLSPLELELVRGSVPVDFFFGNGIRCLESTRARVGSCPRPEADESETETEDGPLPTAERAPPESMRSSKSESPVSDASHTTDECAGHQHAAPLRARAGSTGDPRPVRESKDRAAVHPQDNDLFPPMFFNKTASATREGRHCGAKVAPRLSRLTRLRKLGERLILPHCAPFVTAQKNIDTASISTKRPSKESGFSTFLPSLESRSASRVSSKEGLVLPIVSLQAQLQQGH
jgi:hypothetical protein